MAGLTASSAQRRPPGRLALGFYTVCRAIAVGASYLYLPGRTEGRERLPRQGAYVVAPTHRSYVDWLVVARISRRRLCYVVKAEVWRSRAAGRLLEALGAFAIRRDAADREALRHALAVLERAEPLVVFPEGTRQSGPQIAELREGAAYLAARAGVPLVPVGLAGTEAAMARGSFLPRPHRIHIVVGEPIPPPAPAGGGPAGRVGREVIHELSLELRTRMQETLDEAERRLALPLVSGRPAPDRAGADTETSRSAGTED